MMIRRNYLKLAGGAFIGSSMLSGTAAASYDRVIDVVADLGVDNTGATAIDHDLRPYLRDGIKLEFPDGLYKIDQIVTYKLEDFAMVATGNATLVPGDYPTDGDVWIGGGAVRNLTFQGFTIDSHGTGPKIAFGAFDGLLVKDITKVGAHANHRTAFGFSIWDAKGTGLVENLVATDGDVYNDVVGATAIYSHTTGALTFKDCRIANWGDNGLYASDATGPIQVEGGHYANNNISQVRLSSPGSYVHGTTVKVTKDRVGDRNMRGIRVCDGPGPVDIYNCDISMSEGQGTGGIVVANDGGSINVRNTRIHVDETYTTVGSEGSRTSFGVYVDNPSGITTPTKFLVDGSSVTGGGHWGEAMRFKRGNVTVRDSCINQYGTRNGIYFGTDSAGNSVSNSTVCVPEAPFVRNGASLDTSGTSYKGTCPLPSGIADSEYTPKAITISDAPIPTDASRIYHPTMGTSMDNPVATIYGNYSDPAMAKFVTGNLTKLANDFAETGAITFRMRMIPATKDEDLLVQTGLGVWDKEPENYWPFFAYVFAHQSKDYTTIAGVRDALQAVGVRNYGWIPWLAYTGTYTDLVDADRAAAAQKSLTSWSDYPPLLTFKGDVAAPQYAYDSGVKSWLEQRL